MRAKTHLNGQIIKESFDCQGNKYDGYALFVEPLHILHDVILLPPLGKIDAAVRQEILIADVNKRKILED